MKENLSGELTKDSIYTMRLLTRGIIKIPKELD